MEEVEVVEEIDKVDVVYVVLRIRERIVNSRKREGVSERVRLDSRCCRLKETYTQSI